jgi:serpin B
MKVPRRLAALGLVALLAGCGSPSEPPESPPSPMPIVKQTSLDIATLVDSMNAFGADLLNSPALADQANLVVSPVSVSILLQMVAAGAAGKTAQEMAQVLHLPDGAVVHAQELLRAFGTADLKVSTMAWAQQGLRIKPAFTDVLRTQFNTTLNDADFRRDFEDARNRINKTVAEQTGGKITGLFPAGSLDGDTRLVLTNAIYLVATWAREFKQDRTADAPFTRADGSTVRVPMMHNEPDQDDPDSRLGYAAGPGYQVVTLPYKGGRLAYSVILPTGPDLTDVLRTKAISAILKEVRPALVTLSMPKFTVKSELDLTKALRAGMPSAFADADFSGITTDEALEIQRIQHNTFVQVDEHGTVAAAATGGAMRATSAVQPHVVTVDHPFLFVVTDTATGAPLFLGKVNDPTARD